MKKNVFALLCIGICMVSVYAADTPKGVVDPGNQLDIGFEQNSKVLSAGIMHGGSALGLDFEWGLSYLLGLQAGLGVGGIDAGANLHVASDMKKDLFFSLLAIYLPGFENLVMPSLAFGMRWYFAPAYKVGLSFALGSAIVFKEVERELFDEVVTLEENQVLPRIGVGVSIKL